MLEYLLERYSQTKWPFFSVNDLVYKDKWNREEANLLLKEGKIRKRKGMHGILIELIIEENE